MEKNSLGIDFDIHVKWVAYQRFGLQTLPIMTLALGL